MDRTSNKSTCQQLAALLLLLVSEIIRNNKLPGGRLYFSCCCCCCAGCGSSPKQESKVFPGALPLASAGVGGYGYGPKDQASREPGTCRFLCLNSDLEGKEKQWLKRLASSKVLEEDVSRTYGKPGGPASPAPRFTLQIHPFSGGRDSSGSIPFE